MWVGCKNYVDTQEQSRRLKKRESDPVIQEYYLIYFKINIQMVDIVVNG